MTTALRKIGKGFFNLVLAWSGANHILFYFLMVYGIVFIGFPHAGSGDHLLLLITPFTWSWLGIPFMLYSVWRFAKISFRNGFRETFRPEHLVEICAVILLLSFLTIVILLGFVVQ